LDELEDDDDDDEAGWSDCWDAKVAGSLEGIKLVKG
jgi:hypothetical protein